MLSTVCLFSSGPELGECLNMKYYNSTGASDNSGVILQITTDNASYSDIDGAYGNDRGASAHNQIILHILIIVPKEKVMIFPQAEKINVLL